MNRLISIALLLLVTGSCIESRRHADGPGVPGIFGGAGTFGNNDTSGNNNTSGGDGGAGRPGASGGPGSFGGHGGPSGPGAHGGSGDPNQSACSTALAPSSTEAQQLQAADETCVAEQSGLQAIIDELGVSATNRSNMRQGGGGEGRCKSLDAAALLEANDYTTEATTLRKCIARELSLLAADDSFDMEAIKAKILAKVTGLPVEANTQLGLDGCPEVVEFDVAEYLGCIRAYCETGAAP